MDTETTTARYHAKVRAHGRARRDEQRAIETGTARRDARAMRARARSANRWADAEAKADQQRRAGKLQLIVGGFVDEPVLDHAS